MPSLTLNRFWYPCGLVAVDSCPFWTFGILRVWRLKFPVAPCICPPLRRWESRQFRNWWQYRRLRLAMNQLLFDSFFGFRLSPEIEILGEKKIKKIKSAEDELELMPRWRTSAASAVQARVSTTFGPFEKRKISWKISWRNSSILSLGSSSQQCVILWWMARAPKYCTSIGLPSARSFRMRFLLLFKHYLKSTRNRANSPLAWNDQFHADGSRWAFISHFWAACLALVRILVRGYIRTNEF